MIAKHDLANKCARCGRHYLAHRKNERCPKAKKNPEGSWPRFEGRAP